MGIALRYDTTLACTFTVWDGDVTPEEWRAQTLQRFNDPNFPPGRLALADLSTAGGAPNITNNAIYEMATLWRDEAATIGPLRLAIIPDGAWEKARRFEADLEGSGVQAIVFTSVATACTWLGLNVDVVGLVLRELRG